MADNSFAKIRTDYATLEYAIQFRLPHSKQFKNFYVDFQVPLFIVREQWYTGFQQITYIGLN